MGVWNRLKASLNVGSVKVKQATVNPLALGRADIIPEKSRVGEFAFNLYARLAGENQNENLFFSPYSVSSTHYGGGRGPGRNRRADGQGTRVSRSGPPGRR